jgi:hypothetical protein
MYLKSPKAITLYAILYVFLNDSNKLTGKGQSQNNSYGRIQPKLDERKVH